MALIGAAATADTLTTAGILMSVATPAIEDMDAAILMMERENVDAIGVRAENGGTDGRKRNMSSGLGEEERIMLRYKPH